MSGSDNREYVWSETRSARPEYPRIERWITPRARVIDLGCGNGSLLLLLKERKEVAGFGIELAPSGVAACRQKGLDVRQGRIDVALTDVADRSFDYAICNVTLQMVMYPEVTLREMRRIARYQIISFPNFAFFINRLELLLFGRMPRWGLFGYRWYDTGHIHQLSIADFCALARTFDLTIRQRAYLGKLGKLADLAPNFFAQTAILLLESSHV
ncbi:MAG: methyltransferase domain-containing protein [Chloroflexi bacterium]|nr:methyltransferase domain-containing protein [Chloroflexota bacterium]